MSLRVKCPTCRSLLNVPSKHAGAVIRCPKCEKRLKVPIPPESKTDSETAASKPSPPPHEDRKRPPAPKTKDEAADAKSKPKPPPLPKGKPPTPSPAEAAEKPSEPAAKPSEPETKPVESTQPPPQKKTSVDEAADSSQKRPPGGRVAREPHRGKTEPKSRDKKPVREKPQKPSPPAAPPSHPPTPPPTTSSAEKTKSLTEETRRDQPPTKREKKSEPAKPEAGKSTAAKTAKPPTPPPPPVASKQPPAARDTQATLVEPATVTEADEADEAAEPVRGVEHDAHKLWVVYQLAIAMIAIAGFSLIPAVLDVIEHFRVLNSPGVARWAYALMLVVGIQIAYSIYIIQLPDWSTVWVVSLFTLLMATTYAMLLGLALLSKEHSQIIQWLGLADKLYHNKATGWCFIMLSLTSLLTYFSGRISVRWYQAYQVLIKSGVTIAR